MNIESKYQYFGIFCLLTKTIPEMYTQVIHLTWTKTNLFVMLVYYQTKFAVKSFGLLNVLKCQNI